MKAANLSLRQLEDVRGGADLDVSAVQAAKPGQGPDKTLSIEVGGGPTSILPLES